MAAAGTDASVRLEDGRVLEYWDGGDPGGRPVIVHPGTPVTRILGRWADGAAAAAGVRLLFVNRPGYGRSTLRPGMPSLRAVGRDTVELADLLGIDGFGIVGYSGGGPFAVATAVADPGRVRALAVVAGVGPWVTMQPVSVYPEDRACLALLDGGDSAATWRCFEAQVEHDWVGLTPAEFTQAMIGGERGQTAGDPDYRAIWLQNSVAVLESFDGYIYDNVAWGAPWDVDPRDVVAPTRMWFGSDDESCPADVYGRWFADRIAGAVLTVFEGAGHVDVCDGHWPEILTGVLRSWDEPP